MKIIRQLFLTGLMGCFWMAAIAGNNQTGYVINGQVEGLANGTTLTLVPMSHDNDPAIAEAIVRDGKFQFAGIADEPICARIAVKDAWGGPYVILENVEMNVAGKIASVSDNPNGKFYQWDAKVTGSPLTDKLAEFDARHDALNILYQNYHEKHAAAFEKAQSLNGAERAAYQQSDDFRAAAEAEKEFFDTVERTINGMVNDNKTSFWGPLLMIKYKTYLTEEDGEYYKQLPEEVKNSFYGRKMKEEIWPVGAPGDKVADFSLKGDDGTVYDLAKLTAGKKYVLLDFWASWCGPCRREIPNVKRAYEQFREKGFEVVSISIDKKEDAWRKAVKEEQLVWPNFRSEEVANLFKVKAVPTVYPLDSDGRIVASNAACRGEALLAKLAELLK